MSAKKILMLDLEGVLFVTACPRTKGTMVKKYPILKNNPLPRPHAKKFLEECGRIFDEIILNTRVAEPLARKLMQNLFGFMNFGYWSEFGNPCGKATGYEKFSGDRLVHIEDESPDNPEAKRIMELGHHYVSVRHWGFAAALEGRQDDELLKALEKIKGIISRN